MKVWVLSFKGDYLGTTGLMSCFSLYFGHHLSTIEGGLINTDDREIYNILLALRSHGWDRDLSVEDAKVLSDEWDMYLQKIRLILFITQVLI